MLAYGCNVIGNGICMKCLEMKCIWNECYNFEFECSLNWTLKLFGNVNG